MKSNKIFMVWLLIMVCIIGVGVGIKMSTNDKGKETDVLQTAESKVTAISDLNDSLVGKRITVAGTIKNTKHHDNGHLFFDLEEDNQTIYVALFKDKKLDYTGIEDEKQYQISGMIQEYKGKLELVPEAQEDLVEVTAGNEEELVNEDNIGNEITISCTVINKYENANGNVFLTVKTSNDEEISLPLFSSIGYDSSNISKNTILRVNGKVGKYKNKMQVVPNDAESIEIVKAADETQKQLYKIKNVTEENRGEVIDVRGIPYNISDKNGHYYFYLKDGNASIKAVMFKAESAEVSGRIKKIREYSQSGKAVRVNGTVDIYNGEIEVIVSKVYNND